jgi:ribosome-binding factor A
MRAERKKFLLMEILSKILRERIDPKIVFTVLDISLPQKGSIMKVKISVFPDEKAKEVISDLNKDSIKIKNELKECIYLRYLPKKIIFQYSKDLKEAQEIDKILKELKEEK